MILSAILFALADCDIHTLRMIEPPPAVPYVVPASAVPYPNRSDGSIRLSVNHLGAMYGTLNGLLQRSFFPRWNESIPADMADLTADDLPTYPFNKEGFGYDKRHKGYYVWAYLVPGNLGYYANPTNRDFFGDSLRFYRGAEFLDKVFSTETASLVLGSLDVWSDVRRYWLAVLPGVDNFDFPRMQTNFGGIEDYIAGFVVDDCAAHFSFSGEASPLFLGDLAFRPLLGDATPFSYHGYKELLDKDTGLLPEWAVKNLGYKGLPDFSLQYGDAAAGGASPDGSTRGKAYASAADAFLGEGAWAGLDMADVSRVVSPRVWWGQFALANFVLSLMKVQFLGMKQADWQSQMYAPFSRSKDKWYSCPTVRYSRQPFSGSYRDNKTAACGGFTYNGYVPGSGFHFSADWSEVNSAVDNQTAAEETSLDLGDPQNCKFVAAGWCDTAGSVNYSVQTSLGVYYPDSLVLDPSVVQPDDPFAGEPAETFAMQWYVEGRYFNADTGQLVLYVVPGTDSLGNRLPGVQFSDGSTEKPWKYMLLRSSGVGLPVTGLLTQNRKVSFTGSVPAARHAFTGPSHKESGSQGADQPDDKSLWPMTFHHELYSAGVVKTRINSFTTVGISANPSAAQAVAGGGEFPEAQAYANLDGVNGVKILMRHKTERNNISSPGAWYSAWNSVYDMTSITNDITAIITRWREVYASQIGISASGDEAEREWQLRLNHPTIDAAKDVSDRAKKQLFDDAWKRCTSSRRSAYLVDGAFMSGFTGIDFDIGEGYTNVVVNGSVGAFQFNFGDSEDLKEDERRTSIAVGYEKRCLPFAYWNFPSINGND